MPVNRKRHSTTYEPPRGAYARYLLSSGQYPKPGEVMPEPKYSRTPSRMRTQSSSKSSVRRSNWWNAPYRSMGRWKGLVFTGPTTTARRPVPRGGARYWLGRWSVFRSHDGLKTEFTKAVGNYRFFNIRLHQWCRVSVSIFKRNLQPLLYFWRAYVG